MHCYYERTVLLPQVQVLSWDEQVASSASFGVAVPGRTNSDGQQQQQHQQSREQLHTCVDETPKPCKLAKRDESATQIHVAPAALTRAKSSRRRVVIAPDTNAFLRNIRAIMALRDYFGAHVPHCE